MRNTRSTTGRAYILLETMVAIVVVGTGLTGVMQSLRVSMGGARHATCVTLGCQLAQGRMAELRAGPLSAIGTHDGDFGGDFPGYHWKTTLERVPEEPFFSALVEVSWLEQGQRKSLTLGSLLPPNHQAPAVAAGVP
jgi:hypothetical protein